MSLNELYQKLASSDEVLQAQQFEFYKQAEEEDAAGRIMARGFMDELEKVASPWDPGVQARHGLKSLESPVRHSLSRGSEGVKANLEAGKRSIKAVERPVLNSLSRGVEGVKANLDTGKRIGGKALNKSIGLGSRVGGETARRVGAAAEEGTLYPEALRQGVRRVPMKEHFPGSEEAATRHSSRFGQEVKEQDRLKELEAIKPKTGPLAIWETPTKATTGNFESTGFGKGRFMPNEIREPSEARTPSSGFMEYGSGTGLGKCGMIILEKLSAGFPGLPAPGSAGQSTPGGMPGYKPKGPDVPEFKPPKAQGFTPTTAKSGWKPQRSFGTGQGGIQQPKPPMGQPAATQATKPDTTAPSMKPPKQVTPLRDVPGMTMRND